MAAADRFGLDSNVLVYAVDPRDEPRRLRAIDVIRRAARSGRCTLAVQNIGEFYNVTTRKRMLEPGQAVPRARELMALFPNLARPDDAAVRLALAEAEAGRYAYYDALLVATLGRAGCRTMLSEDMRDGAALAGVTILNPFAGDRLPDAVAAVLAGTP